MFSKTCEYAIRAMIFIAQKSKGGSKAGIKEIAKAIDSPEYFIAKILQDLSRKSLAQSLKGPTGGFYVEDESSLCSLADIAKAIDVDKLFTGCGLGLKNYNELRWKRRSKIGTLIQQNSLPESVHFFQDAVASGRVFFHQILALSIHPFLLLHKKYPPIILYLPAI